jgi:hypothetical protein
MHLSQNDYFKIMSFRNRYLFIIFSIVCLVALLLQWRNHNKTADEYDRPKQLSGNTETIDLMHIDRNCDCADWVEARLGKNSGGLKKEDYIFIEPASSGLEVPASYWALADSGYVLRLNGQFYKGEAIPEGYPQKTDQKPEKARVFYYTATEVVKPE